MLHILLGLLALIFALPAGDEPDTEPKPDPEPDPEPDEDDLGEAGKRALTAERKERKAADKRAKAAEAKAEKAQKALDDAAAANDSDQEKAIKAAAEEAKKATAATYGSRIIRSEVISAAKGKMVTPADAVGLLDLTEFDPDADPDELVTTINAAIDQLLQDRPYLRADKTPGDGDGGAKPKPASKDEKLTPRERIRRGYASTTKK